MRILEITTYTAGGCGVGARVLKEAEVLSKKGHEVTVFSTNIEKGTGKVCSSTDKINGVKVRRFPGRKLGGESFTYWNFEKEALEFKPEIMIVHAYRHTHTTKALKIAEELNAKIFLVTHAPFDRNSSRSYFQKLAVSFYDSFIGRPSLKRFDKIIAISKWEIPYLEKLGVKKDKIAYIPNGLDKIFFGKTKEKNKIVYSGRVAPIKNLEVLIRALSRINDSPELEILGPVEEEYFKKLKNMLKSVKFINKRYDKKEQIKFLDSGKYFVLPSKSEGMPQSLIEAMARGKIVIASDNKGNSDIIKDGVNGFLFKNGDEESLREVLEKAFKLSVKEEKKIKSEAVKTAKEFNWGKLILKLEKLF